MPLPLLLPTNLHGQLDLVVKVLLQAAALPLDLLAGVAIVVLVALLQTLDLALILRLQLLQRALCLLRLLCGLQSERRVELVSLASSVRRTWSRSARS